MSDSTITPTSTENHLLYLLDRNMLRVWRLMRNGIHANKLTSSTATGKEPTLNTKLNGMRNTITNSSGNGRSKNAAPTITAQAIPNTAGAYTAISTHAATPAGRTISNRRSEGESGRA